MILTSTAGTALLNRRRLTNNYTSYTCIQSN